MFLKPKFGSERQIVLSAGTTLIGRDGIVAEGTLKRDSRVSHRHAELVVEADSCKIRDLESRNGTFLNAKKLEPNRWVELNNGDNILLCEYEFQFFTTAFASDGSGGSSGSKSISMLPQARSGLDPTTQLRALLAMAEALRDPLHTEELLLKSISILFEIFVQAERAAIAFTSKDEILAPVCWRSRDHHLKDVVQISRTIADHVLSSCEAILTNDALVGFGEAESVNDSRMRSVMCAPIVDPDGKAIGLIHLDSMDVDRFEAFDLELLAAVATQISLAVNFSRLHAAAVADAVLRHDVESAREVQRQYLPTTTPGIEGYDLAGFYRAARHVGGDYFDFIELPGGRVAMVIGDVVGKGVPAALTMVRLASETRASVEVCDGPAAILNRLKRKISHTFITMVIAILDPHRNTVTISNAGHEPPLICGANGQVRPMFSDEAGLPLIDCEHDGYLEASVELVPGDRLVFFSDGFPDSTPKTMDVRFGKDRIVQIFRDHKHGGKNFIDKVVAQIDDFVGNGPQFDDMCMIYLARN